MIDYISLTGAVLSIIFSVISFIIFLKNKTIRNEIIIKNQINALTDFYVNSKNIIKNIRKYTTVKPDTQNYTIGNFVKLLQDYYELLKNIEHKVPKDSINQLKKHLDSLESEIKFYSIQDSDIFLTSKEKINNIYLDIIKSQNIIKSINDEKIFKS